MEKKSKEVLEDRDKLRVRLRKLQQRRKLFDQEQKTCRNCSKEYLDSENYNWSCRTHTSEFGGEMWWCCGKAGMVAQGCKFARHEPKNDDDELDEQELKEKEEMKERVKNLSITCFTCGERGHKAKACTRDPNLRPGQEAWRELKRIDRRIFSTKRLTVNLADQAQADACNEAMGKDVIPETDETEPNGSPFEDLVTASRSSYGLMLVENAEKLRSDEDTIEEGEFEAEGASDDEVEGESGSSSGSSSTDEEERLQRHVSAHGSIKREAHMTRRRVSASHDRSPVRRHEKHDGPLSKAEFPKMSDPQSTSQLPRFNR